MTNTDKSNKPQKALVTVFEDLDMAQTAIIELRANGFHDDQLELVTRHVSIKAPEIDVPKVRETTTSTMVDDTLQGGAMGLGISAVAALVAPFPGLGLGMIAVGGLTGAIIGGMAGAEHAAEDDSVNLPTIADYEKHVQDGCCLVVVLGNHDEAMKAEDVILELPNIHTHMHIIQGHEFHEHPAKAKRDK